MHFRMNKMCSVFLLISNARGKSVGTTEPHYNKKKRHHIFRGRHHVLDGIATIKFKNTGTNSNELVFQKCEFKDI